MHLKSPTYNHLKKQKANTCSYFRHKCGIHSRKIEGRCWSEAIGSSTGPLPAVTLVLLSHTYRYTPYINLFLVAGTTTTKLIFTSTISSPPTPFHRCREGIFGFWLHLAQPCTVTSYFQCYQSQWETLFITCQCQLAGSTTLVTPGIVVILHQPVCISSGCSSRGRRAVLQPSSCKHMLAQVVHSHP